MKKTVTNTKDFSTRIFHVEVAGCRLRAKSIERMEERIQKVKQEIEKRKGLKDQIIDQRIEELTVNDELTKW